MKIVFYVVVNGRKTGVFCGWEECRKNVENFSGSEFKKFNSKEEANRYYSQIKNERKNIEKVLGSKKDDIYLSVADLQKKYASKEEAICFVDGSYCPEQNKYGFGGVLISGGNVRQFSQLCFDNQMASMRNVAGEIMGATEAIRLSLVTGVKVLNICYDFEGIEKWCTGNWKCHCDAAAEYKRFYDFARRMGMKIHFIKVKSHASIPMNDFVDSLARNTIFAED